MKFGYLIEPPFNYRTPGGLVSGHDVELARHIFKTLEIDSFEPVETEFSELLPGLSDGRWRMTTGLFATKERCRSAIFSHPIWALPDGLLIPKGNPLSITGYTSIAKCDNSVLAVIRDQFQHRSAVTLGVPEERLKIFETYSEAALAVREGNADAYASVGRAHSGFIAQNLDWEIDFIEIPTIEKAPAFGSFAFALEDKAFRDRVDEVLHEILGSDQHKLIAKEYGFTDAEINLVSIC